LDFYFFRLAFFLGFSGGSFATFRIKSSNLDGGFWGGFVSFNIKDGV